MGEEQVGGLVLGVTAVALAPFVHWLTRACAEGNVARNHLAGIRTRRTLSSDQAWLTGHRAALRWTRRTAWVTGLLGVVTVGLAVASAVPASLAAGLGAIATLLAGLFLAVRDAHRAIDDLPS